MLRVCQVGGVYQKDLGPARGRLPWCRFATWMEGLPGMGLGLAGRGRS